MNVKGSTDAWKSGDEMEFGNDVLKIKCKCASKTTNDTVFLNFQIRALNYKKQKWYVLYS